MIAYGSEITFCGWNHLSRGCFKSQDLFFTSFQFLPYPAENTGHRINFRLGIQVKKDQNKVVVSIRKKLVRDFLGFGNQNVIPKSHVVMLKGKLHAVLYNSSIVVTETNSDWRIGRQNCYFMNHLRSAFYDR